MIPLQVGVPGGVELLVILLIALIVFGLPVVLIGGGLYLYRQSQSDRPAGAGGEIEALRTEVERLREEVDRLEDGDGGRLETEEGNRLENERGRRPEDEDEDGDWPEDEE